MQKKIIALAIAAAFSAPAFADTANVTVYGSVNMSVNSVTVGDAGAGGTATNTTYSATKVASDTSVIGLKGSEDLGGGLSAIWQIESQVDVDNAGGTFATRNSFAGLSDKAMGTVLMGKHDTPYKMADRAIDVFGNGIADNRSIMGGNAFKFNAAAAAVTNNPSAVANFDGRPGNVIAYVSPNFSGMQVIAAYVAGAEDNTGGTQGSAKSASVSYTMDGLYVAAAYEVHNFGTNGSGTVAAPANTAGVDAAGMKESAMKLAASYKIDALTVGVAVEKTSDDLATGMGGSSNDAFGHTAFYASAKYNMDANNAVKLAYTKAGETSQGGASGAKDGATQVSVGFDHNMSKRTAVYALYTSIANDDNGTYGLSAASTAGTGSLSSGYAGAKVSAFGVGMRHSF